MLACAFEEFVFPKLWLLLKKIWVDIIRDVNFFRLSILDDEDKLVQVSPQATHSMFSGKHLEFA